jgi:UDP-2-acetamido-2-deoxy-ribo-hexuluronate aminotransferase
MQFIDLAGQQKLISAELNSNIQRVLEHGKYIMGPEVSELEEKLAAYVGTKHAVGCSSGTDALLLALMAYHVGPGDAVFVTPFTFISSVEVICLLGAIPILVDITPDTFNMNPTELVKAISCIESGDSSNHPIPSSCKPSRPKPKAIMPIDLFGLPADYDSILSIAEDHGLVVIEDAAQAFGAEYGARKACSLGNVGCTSFFPAKPLGCYGDGGMCFTDDNDIAEVLRSLRVHGKGQHKYDNVRIGINGRLDTLQAAILLAKFTVFPKELSLRDQVAQRYTELFSVHANPVSSVASPRVPPGSKSAWAQYSVLLKNEAHRDAIQDKLKALGVPTAIYYPMPLHLQGALEHLGYKTGDFPVSEECSRRVLSLPMHPYLGKRDQEKIVSAICGD